MALPFFAASSAVEANGGNLTLTEPTGAQAGDLLVAVISYRSTPAFANPTDWATIATQQSSGNTTANSTSSIGSGHMAYIVRGSSAPSYVFTRTAGDIARGFVLCYRPTAGLVAAYDTGSANTLASASTTVTTGTISPAHADSLLVMACCSARNASASAQRAATLPLQSGWHERGDSSTTTGADCGIAAADATKLTAEATGELRYTQSSSARHVCIVGAFYTTVADAPVRKLEIGALNGNNEQASYTTASFTPPNNSLLVVVLSASTDNGDLRSGTGVSGGSLTWTSRCAAGATNVYASVNYYSTIEIWTAPVTTGASMTVTVTPSQTADFFDVEVYSITGHNVASPVGATGTLTSFATDATPIVLGSAPAATSLVMAAKYQNPNNQGGTTAKPGNGWTESYDGYDTNDGGNAVQERRGSTSTDCAWLDIDEAGVGSFMAIGVAIEIKIAAATATPRSFAVIIG
jgi:hypothetical protein